MCQDLEYRDSHMAVVLQLPVYDGQRQVHARRGHLGDRSNLGIRWTNGRRQLCECPSLDTRARNSRQD